MGKIDRWLLTGNLLYLFQSSFLHWNRLYKICFIFVSFMARSESHCLQWHILQCIKYQIFWLNHSNSSAIFLLPYQFLRLIASEQIFTNAGNWGGMALREHKCIILIHSAKCFLFKVKERKNIYWMLTACQELYVTLYIFISILESFFFLSYHFSIA